MAGIQTHAQFVRAFHLFDDTLQFFKHGTAFLSHDITEMTVKRMVAEDRDKGLEEFIRNKYTGGNHRSLSEEEEKEILSRFEKLAEAGQVVTGQDIKKAFDERIGKDTGRGYIYMLLKRHGWRKVMPRAKHPKKADEEAIEASKN